MCAATEGQTYGYRTDVWERAKTEAIRAIVRRCSPIFYSDLVTHIPSIAFGRMTPRFIISCTRSQSRRMPQAEEC